LDNQIYRGFLLKKNLYRKSFFITTSVDKFKIKDDSFFILFFRVHKKNQHWYNKNKVMKRKVNEIVDEVFDQLYSLLDKFVLGDNKERKIDV
jgi:hypothetical protein